MTFSPYLIVKDMAASIAFYKAYFEEEPTYYAPGRFVNFEAGNTRLSLYNPKYDEELVQSGADVSGHFNAAYLANMKNSVTYGNNVVLNIGVDDLMSEYERVQKLNIGAVSEIMYVNIAAPYYYFILYDPDGNCLEITGKYSLQEDRS
jgi:lactoylglutathione lyase